MKQNNKKEENSKVVEVGADVTGVELYPKILQCWARPNPNTLLRYTLSYYNAKQFPSSNTLLSYTQS